MITLPGRRILPLWFLHSGDPDVIGSSLQKQQIISSAIVYTPAAMSSNQVSASQQPRPLQGYHTQVATAPVWLPLRPHQRLGTAHCTYGPRKKSIFSPVYAAASHYAATAPTHWGLHRSTAHRTKSRLTGISGLQPRLTGASGTQFRPTGTSGTQFRLTGTTLYWHWHAPQQSIDS
ncbi:unnamed protein product [Arctia plantaginis]|uniref:Uncharacterized protein n=1 Tax=Arctia plantaginis TaxID=874455 RepID=A0A8S1AZB9_ARCPL|nr:unnamed protein product [Arctia plantaginis]